MKKLGSLLICLVVSILLPVLALADGNKDRIGQSAQKLENVSLQLNWRHQFEFAGFYAAIEQGYYASHGLKVNLLEYGQDTDIVEEVRSGRADYATHNLQIVAERLNGAPISLLANYFKRYPMAILTQPGISTLEELRGKRLMASDKDLQSPLIQYAFREAGLVPGENLTTVSHTYNSEAFARGEVDAMVVFLTNEPFELLQQDIPYQVIDLVTLYPALGGNYLFSLESSNPHIQQRDQAFVEASNEGWRYALEHPEEIINLILDQYSQRKPREALQFEATQIKRFMMTRSYPIGSIEADRIEAVANMLLEVEAVPDKELLQGFIRHSAGEPTIALTDAEKKWLAQHPVIRVANEMDWPPYDYVSNDQPAGYSIDLLKMIAGKLGIQLQFVNELSWEELLQYGRDRKIDVFPAIWKNADRESFLDFSRSYAQTPHILLVRDDEPDISSIHDLAGKTLAGIPGFADVEIVREHYPEIKIQNINNIQEGMLAVSYGHADAFIGTLGAISHILNKELITGLRIVGETTLDGRLEAGKLYMANRNDWPELTSILQKGMNALSEEERTALSRKWLVALSSFDSPRTSGKVDQSLQELALITIVLGALFLLAIRWLTRHISDDALSHHVGALPFRLSVIAVLLVIVTLIGFMTMQTLAHEKVLAKQEIDQELSEVLENTVEHLRNWEQEQKRFLMQLGRDPKLVELTRQLLQLPISADLIRQSVELAELRHFFAERERDFGDMGFFIINRAHISIGALRDSNLATVNLIAQQRPDLLRRVFAGEAVFIPPIQTDVPLYNTSQDIHKNGQTTMFFAVPITDESGKTIAALTQRLRPEARLSGLMKYGQIGDTGETYAVDKFGRMATASRHRSQLIEIGLLEANEMEHGNLLVTDPGVNLLEEKPIATGRSNGALTQAAQAIVKYSEEYTHQLGQSPLDTSNLPYRDYRGVPVYGAWQWNAELELGIISEVTVEEAMAAYNKLQTNVTIIAGLALLFSLATSVMLLFLAERITRIMARSNRQLDNLIAEHSMVRLIVEKQLEESDEKYQLLASLSEDPTWIIVDKHIVACNLAACEQLQYYSIKELLNQHPAALSPDYQQDGTPSLEKANTLLTRALGQGSIELSWVLRRKDGSNLPVNFEVSAIPFQGKAGLFCTWQAGKDVYR